jgi:hypothetical protein
MQPGIDFPSEVSFDRILLHSQLFLKPLRAKQGDARRTALDGPASPHQSDVEVEGAWSVSESRDHLTLDWNAMLIDLSIERLTERDDVFGRAGCRASSLMAGAPQLHPIKEVKA